MEDKKKWTDKDVVHFMSLFTANILALRFISDKIDDKICDFYIKVSDTLLEKCPSNENEAINIIADISVDADDLFEKEAILWLESKSKAEVLLKMFPFNDKENRNE